MAGPTDSATAATPQSPPSPSIKVETHQQDEQETVNAASQNVTQLSEFQQPPKDSIADFRKLSDAFSAFQRCFAKLQKHGSIQTLIDSMRTSPSTRGEAATTAAPEAEPSSESDPSKEEEAEDVKSQKSPGTELKSTNSKSESLCEKMDGRGLRKYMIAHLEDINEWVEQVSKALKLSPNPARLLLDCLGMFYLQGSKAYVKGSPMFNGRNASILVLEVLLDDGIDEHVEIEKEVKEEAEKAALLWRKRLIAEGGVRKAYDMDARGLLLLIGCFGFQEDFRGGIRSVTRCHQIKIGISFWINGQGGSSWCLFAYDKEKRKRLEAIDMNKKGRTVPGESKQHQIVQDASKQKERKTFFLSEHFSKRAAPTKCSWFLFK
ncbi:putative chaperone protein ClpD, chloroplastic-like isoform X1 [Capsicum annuum]|nr:putative chaperone protein ClpD, chloroplastic-like isoform X1 [Capsicum annuum]KAF3650893.1 putative chaperone protein ClpD, chloroplastic-like isoform X1 [Capsicum annuum]